MSAFKPGTFVAFTNPTGDKHAIYVLGRRTTRTGRAKIKILEYTEFTPKHQGSGYGHKKIQTLEREAFSLHVFKPRVP